MMFKENIKMIDSPIVFHLLSFHKSTLLIPRIFMEATTCRHMKLALDAEYLYFFLKLNALALFYETNG